MCHTSLLCLKISKPAKKAVSSTPEGLGATHYRACTHATVPVCRRITQRDKPRRATTPAIVFAVRGDVPSFGGFGSALRDCTEEKIEES